MVHVTCVRVEDHGCFENPCEHRDDNSDGLVVGYKLGLCVHHASETQWKHKQGNTATIPHQTQQADRGFGLIASTTVSEKFVVFGDG